MRYLSAEPFWFSKIKYQQQLNDASPDDLWKRECRKTRTKAGSTTAVIFGCALMVPTVGLALPGLVLSGRVLDIARTKSKLVQAEVERRNLPHYRTKVCDIAIPVGLALTVFATVGILDIIFLTGTSSAVAFDAGNAGVGAIQAMSDKPGEFFAGTLQGFELHNQQFLQLPHEGLAIAPEPTSVAFDEAGNYIVEPAAHSSAPPAALTPTGGGVGGAKAAVALEAHQFIAANQPDGQAATVAATDRVIHEAAATGSHQAQVAGIGFGMVAGAALHKQAATNIIADTGFVHVAERITTSAGPLEQNRIHEIQPRYNKTGTNVSACREALTGKQQLTFMFLSKKKTRISQRIVTPSSSRRCQHSGSHQDFIKCHFCTQDIDVTKQAYYHCCKCECTRGSAYNICEICVASRGCSCTKDRDHILFRQGRLSHKVNFGLLEDMGDSEDEESGDKKDD